MSSSSAPRRRPRWRRPIGSSASSSASAWTRRGCGGARGVRPGRPHGAGRARSHARPDRRHPGRERDLELRLTTFQADAQRGSSGLVDPPHRPGARLADDLDRGLPLPRAGSAGPGPGRRLDRPARRPRRVHTGAARRRRTRWPRPRPAWPMPPSTSSASRRRPPCWPRPSAASWMPPTTPSSRPRSARSAASAPAGARKRLEEARAHERELLDRHGFASYLDVTLSGGRANEHDGDRLAAERAYLAALAGATRSWPPSRPRRSSPTSSASGPGCTRTPSTCSAPSPAMLPSTSSVRTRTCRAR